MTDGVRSSLDFDISEALRGVDRLDHELTSTITGAQDRLRKLSANVTVNVTADVTEAASAIGGLGDESVTVNTSVIGDDAVEDVARDVEHVGDEAAKAEPKVERLGGSFVKLGDLAKAAATGIVAVKLFDFFQDSVDAASDLNESLSKSQAVFGDASSEIKKFGDTAATSVGLARRQAIEAAATFGNLFVAMGLGKDTAAGLSTDIVTLGADLASFNNLDVPDALEKLRSGLVGEVEPLRALGVNFNAAQVEAKAMSLGLVDVNGEISEGAKVQARYALIVEQTTAAHGDFARTSGGLANQLRIAKAEFENTKEEIGSALLPVVLDLAKAFRDDVVPLIKDLATDALPALIGAAEKLAPTFTIALDVLGDLSPILGVLAGIIDAIPDPLITMIAAFAGFSKIRGVVADVSLLNRALALIPAQASGAIRGIGLLGGALATFAVGVQTIAAGHERRKTKFITDLIGDPQTLDETKSAIDTLKTKLAALQDQEGKGRVATLGLLDANIFITNGDAERQDQIDATKGSLSELESQEKTLTATEKALADATAATAAAAQTATTKTASRFERLADAAAALKTASTVDPSKEPVLDALVKFGPALESTLDIFATGTPTLSQYLDVSDRTGVSIGQLAQVQQDVIAKQRAWADSTVDAFVDVNRALQSTDDSEVGLEQFVANYKKQVDDLANFTANVKTLVAAGFGTLAHDLANSGQAGTKALAEAADAIRNGRVGYVKELDQTLADQHVRVQGLGDDLSHIGVAITTTLDDAKNQVAGTVLPFDSTVLNSLPGMDTALTDVLGHVGDFLTRDGPGLLQPPAADLGAKLPGWFAGGVRAFLPASEQDVLDSFSAFAHLFGLPGPVQGAVEPAATSLGVQLPTWFVGGARAQIPQAQTGVASVFGEIAQALGAPSGAVVQPPAMDLGTKVPDWFVTGVESQSVVGQNGLIGVFRFIAEVLSGQVPADLEGPATQTGNVVIDDFLGGADERAKGSGPEMTAFGNLILGNLADGADWDGGGYGVGSDIATGLGRGLRSQDLPGLATSIVGGIITAARAKAETGSPSKVMIRLGKDMAEGLRVGLVSGIDPLATTAELLASAAVPAVQPHLVARPTVVAVPNVAVNGAGGFGTTANSSAGGVVNQTVNVTEVAQDPRATAFEVSARLAQAATR